MKIKKRHINLYNNYSNINMSKEEIGMKVDYVKNFTSYYTGPAFNILLKKV